jgi:hypothetical protein
MTVRGNAEARGVTVSLRNLSKQFGEVWALRPIDLEIDPGELPAVAENLEAVASAPSADIGGDWADWGRFRAIVHRVVHEALGT